nr:hypothetical protein [Haloarchaeobius salinus]
MNHGTILDDGEDSTADVLELKTRFMREYYAEERYGGASDALLAEEQAAELSARQRLRWAFWLWNVGLAVMVFVSVLPVGFLQLDAAFTESNAYARSLEFYNSETSQLLFWACLPGDTLIILGTGVFAYDVRLKRFSLRDVSSSEDRPSSIPEPGARRGRRLTPSPRLSTSSEHLRGGFTRVRTAYSVDVGSVTSNARGVTTNV